MKVRSPASPRNGGRPDREARFGPRMLSAAVVATAIVGLGILHGPSNPARAGDDSPPASGTASHAAHVAEIQRELKVDDLRLSYLAREVLEDPTKPGRDEDRLDRLRIDAIKAEGDYQQARLRSEIAELAFKEYVEAILPNGLTAAECEICAAQADLSKASTRVRDANEGEEKATALDDEKKAASALEKAEDKKQHLIERGKGQEARDLESRFSKARSDERSQRPTWELLKNRFEKQQKVATIDPGRAEVVKRILGMLDRAASLEERVQAKFQQFKDDANPGEATPEEIRGLLDRIGAIIDEAEAVKAAADSARFKPRLQGSAPPRQDVVAAGTSAGSAVASPRSDSIGEVRRALKVLDRRLAGLTRNGRERSDHGASIRDLLVSQRITTKSAEASYMNSNLAREVAQIAIREYEEGVFVQDLAALEIEIKLAESTHMRAIDLVESAEKAEHKHWARLNERRASLALKLAEGKKGALVEYTKPRTLKDLECEVVRCRADELTKKAIWEKEKRREEGLGKAVAADGRRSAVEDQRTSLLRRAASLEERIRAAVSRLGKEANSDEALQKEIREWANQLGTMVDEAEAASAADNFAGLRPRIRDAARRAGVSESK